MTINYEVIVTCAVTGAGDTVDKHPAIPVTPEQVADAAIEAADAEPPSSISMCATLKPGQAVEISSFFDSQSTGSVPAVAMC